MEGDLGVRYNATSLLELAGCQRLLSRLPLSMSEQDIVNTVHSFHMNIGRLTRDKMEISVETAICRVAVEIEVERHVGHL